jgi:hypothetical protein
MEKDKDKKKEKIVYQGDYEHNSDYHTYLIVDKVFIVEKRYEIKESSNLHELTC